MIQPGAMGHVMMGGMALFSLLVLILVILGIASLIKYLFGLGR